MLKKNRKNRHYCLTPDFRENAFIYSPFSTVLAIGLSQITSLC
jgi:hypothetical protein